MSKTYKPLDDLLGESGMKFTTISERIGLTSNAFYRVRVNPRKLTLEKIQRLGSVTGIDPDRIYQVSKNFTE
ncbi:plasmid maintenance system antidote protein VapI [Lactovum miscens]|uniref:Plasmid maintenance system antidote protein VapI n=1 Tax=Lactovum miscens TaxID=190387 RepID=A0A841C8J4_9LACT|nr:plasmid maintenance system antidote protein VapI [Lactovum miscens]